MSLASIASIQTINSYARVINLNNFSVGGRVPLYRTRESEIKFDIEYDNDYKSSSDEELFLHHDDSSGSEASVEPAPNTPHHNPSITPYAISKGSVIFNPSTSNMVNHSKQNDSLISITQSKDTQTLPINRARSTSNHRVRHLTQKSFHHFRIKSITIHGASVLQRDTDDENHSEATMNAAINAMDAMDPYDIIEPDCDLYHHPHHNKSGTVLIDGHPPLPSSPTSETNTNVKVKFADAPSKKRVTFKSSEDVPKRKYVEKEIIETEETYYRGLDILLNELLIPMFEENLIDTSYYEQCISNIPELLAFHDKFLSELIEAYEHKPDIDDGDSFKSISKVFTAQNKEEFIDLYLKYIREYDAILDLFGNKFHKNTKLKMYLKAKRKERKPLTNFLILPVQRVPRYILLLTDLKKHSKPEDSDYKDIEAALDLVQEITNEINERQREIESISQCLQIQEALSNLTEPIVKIGRMYQKQFVFVKKTNKHQRQFFCFNDIIIVTNHHWSVKAIMDIRTVDIKRNIPLITKKKSFRARFVPNRSKEDLHEQTDESSKYSEFVLLYSNVKPCCYVSKCVEDVEEFERMMKDNRLELMDHDLAQENDTSELRETLKVIGVSQSDDYKQEIKSKKTIRQRGNASADIHDVLPIPNT